MTEDGGNADTHSRGDHQLGSGKGAGGATGGSLGLLNQLCHGRCVGREEADGIGQGGIRVVHKGRINNEGKSLVKAVRTDLFTKTIVNKRYREVSIFDQANLTVRKYEKTASMSDYIVYLSSICSVLGDVKEGLGDWLLHVVHVHPSLHGPAHRVHCVVAKTRRNEATQAVEDLQVENLR